MQRILILLILVGLGGFAYDKYQGRLARPARLLPAAEPSAWLQPPVSAAPVAPTFRCDGRIHCSQMGSCAEATYFLKNCPGTKMDGNHDGVPCESQWCR